MIDHLASARTTASERFVDIGLSEIACGVMVKAFISWSAETTGNSGD